MVWLLKEIFEFHILEYLTFFDAKRLQYIALCVCFVWFRLSKYFLSKGPSLWATTFNGRHPSMEDDLRWKTTYDGRRPMMEDDLRWKTTYDGRQPMIEDDL